MMISVPLSQRFLLRLSGTCLDTSTYGSRVFLLHRVQAIPPMAFRLTGEDDSRRLPFETIESEEFIFITARLPSRLISAPHVEIMQDALHVFIDERVAVIVLRAPVEMNRSHFTVRNRILDITLQKITKS